jgi:histidine triad (HIT) family protein
MEKQDCFICRKHRGEIAVPGGCIYENKFVYVGHIGSNEKSVYIGYLIVDLKRHAPGFGDMTEEESRAVGSVLNIAGRALKHAAHAEHIYSFVQGDAFPHFHVHLIPRYANTPHEYWNPMNLRNWSGAHGQVDQVEEVCASIRDFMMKEAE